MFRRFSRRRPVTRRRPVRHIGRRRRTVRRGRVSRRGMTRRRVLQIASVKKHDDMPPAVATGGGSHTVSSWTFATTSRSLFLASARPEYVGDVSADTSRTSKDTFCVGYKERTIIDVRNPQHWYWRRIVFRFYGDPFIGTGTVDSVPFYDDPARGMTRNVNLMNLAQTNALQGIIYEGTQGVDWDDERVAQINRTKIKLISDITRHLSSGNDQAHTHITNNWYPVRKRLIYNDSQQGNRDISTNYVSAQEQRSCGDVYVYDFFFNTLGDIAQTVTATFQGRYYWQQR